MASLSKILKAIRAYHGSPHDFDKFDMSKIGTGEGAQAYGHGLYFAGKEDVARQYRDRLSDARYEIPDEGKVAERYGEDVLSMLNSTYGDPKEIAANAAHLRDMIQRNLRLIGASSLSDVKPAYEGDFPWTILNTAKRLDNLDALLKSDDIKLTGQGRMYEVDIHADPESLLDWDKPFTEQPKRVQDTLGDLYSGRWGVKLTHPDGTTGYLHADDEGMAKNFADYWRSKGSTADLDVRGINPETKGKALYQGLTPNPHSTTPLPPPRASARLREAGIPGLKYLDGMSRSAGDGTHNYVTFDDSLVDIKRKYEQGGEVEMAGGGIVKQGKKAIGALARATGKGADAFAGGGLVNKGRKAIGVLAKAAGKGADAADELERAIPDLQTPFIQSNPQFSRFAEEYPAAGPPRLGLTFKADGKTKNSGFVPHPEGKTQVWDPNDPDEGIGNLIPEGFWSKMRTPEEAELWDVRTGIKQDMASGYQPYFNPENRFDATGYDRGVDTSIIRPKQAKTIEKYEAHANSPEAIGRLNQAYDRGMLQESGAAHWYKMGQLQDAYIQTLGRDAGMAAFKRDFADAMGATTAGADPEANLMMAHWGNFLRNRANGGEMIIPRTHQAPPPIMGQYVGNNMRMYKQMVEGDGTFDIWQNPKRANFIANFLGDPTRATVDKQMSQLFDPKMSLPGDNAYGIYEDVLVRLAKERGVDPRYFQEVAWAGAKDLKTKGGYKARPMIDIVNDTIERTHRLTGMSRDEIVARGLVRGEIPLYAEGGPVRPQAPKSPLARMAEMAT